jgi:hypothetical protein
MKNYGTIHANWHSLFAIFPLMTMVVNFGCSDGSSRNSKSARPSDGQVAYSAGTTVSSENTEKATPLSEKKNLHLPMEEATHLPTDAKDGDRKETVDVNIKDNHDAQVPKTPLEALRETLMQDSWCIQIGFEGAGSRYAYPLAGCVPAEPTSVSPNRESINKSSFRSRG